MSSDFDQAFVALRRLLKRHAQGMIVLVDTPSEYTVATPATMGKTNRPVWFGCVQTRKNAVTYHLMPLYFNPKLQSAVSPALLATKQGKTCFHFQAPDPALFGQLEELTRQARDHWQAFLEAGPLSKGVLDEMLVASGEDPNKIDKLRKQKGKAAAKKRAATIKKKKAAVKKKKKAKPAKRKK